MNGNMKNVTITINEFNRLLSLIYRKNTLQGESIKDLYIFVDNALIKLEKGSISYEEQNSIETYIYYLKTKKITEKLYPKEFKVLEKYDEIIDNKNRLRREKEAFYINEETKKLKLTNLLNNTKNGIISVVILEVTLLLGILISIIALANK